MSVSFLVAFPLPQNSREVGLARLRTKHASIGCGARDVFTNTEILSAVHKFHLYEDSKDFVDSPLTADAMDVVAHFWNYVDVDSVDSVKAFLEMFFSGPGSELMPIEPRDWQPSPSPIVRLTNDDYKLWALELHQLWKQLCRQMRDDVQKFPDRFSLVYVPHSFIVPGGRFREFFYWDSYWILKGLLVSEMFDTAKDMIRNLVYLVERFGFIPNGGRTYLLSRSQPPFLIPIVYDYITATNDLAFLAEILPVLVEENIWWYKNRMATVTLKSGKSYTLFQYGASTKSPRPESFKEDIKTASVLSSESEKELLYQNIVAACESGWDFSSRWFACAENLSSCATTNILPADLNAVMCLNAELLYRMHQALGNETAALAYKQRWQDMLQEFSEVFWSEEDGCWFDFWLTEHSHNRNFYASSVVPIFAKCYADVRQVSRCLAYIRKSGALSSYNGGLAMSMANTGEQWDFPNAWAPLVHMLIIGLNETCEPDLKQAARSIAEQWLQLNYKLYEKTGDMFEKYDVSRESIASGGEYEVQTGFGWTNGVVLDLLSIFYSSTQQ